MIPTARRNRGQRPGCLLELVPAEDRLLELVGRGNNQAHRGIELVGVEVLERYRVSGCDLNPRPLRSEVWGYPVVSIEIWSRRAGKSGRLQVDDTYDWSGFYGAFDLDWSAVSVDVDNPLIEELVEAATSG